jgi:uncharacterized membrane protein
MWNRAELKSRAKLQMKNRYWNYLGVSLLPVLASYVMSIPISIITQVLSMIGVMGGMFGGTGMIQLLEQMEDMNPEAMEDFFSTFGTEEAGILLKGFVAPYIFTMIATLLVTVLVILPLSVGVVRWYIRARETANPRTNLCFSPFKKGVYGSTTWSMLYYRFWEQFFMTVFFPVGIVKHYSYGMIPYILADNPTIGARRALKLSKDMTRGHKLDIFVLDLSFLGWYLIGFFACCIGMYAVIPYVHATKAELYDVLKKESVNQGYCTMEELGYIAVSPSV